MADGAFVLGALFSPRLTIRAIGRSLTNKTGRIPKHAIKQTDRLVGTSRIAYGEMFREISRVVVGVRSAIMVSLDWTEYD